MKEKLNRVLIISYLDYPFPVGLSRRITGLTTLLVHNGIKVKILAPNSRGKAHFSKKGQKGNYHIERINLKASGLRESNKFALKLLQWLMFSTSASFKVAKTYIKHNYLIQYQSFYSVIPALFAKLFLKAKIVGDDIVIFNNFIDFILLKFTDIVVTPSFRTYSLTRRLGRRSLYIPNGIERSLEKSISNTTSTILFVGALSFDQNLKAVENIVKIASNLDKNPLAFEILIVGGPLSYVEHLMDHPVVKKGRVKFLGRVSKDRLEELYSSSHLGILPFFQDTPLLGGQRTKALEFFANNLVVVSGPEGVKGINGLEPSKHYLLANSIDEMCMIVNECLSEPKKYQNMAESGARYVSENYSWQTLAKEYINLIRRLLPTKKQTVQL